MANGKTRPHGQRRTFAQAFALASFVVLSSRAVLAGEVCPTTQSPGTFSDIDLPQVQYTPVSVPFEIAFEVTNSPMPSGEVSFRVVVTPSANIDVLNLDFSATGNLALAADLDQELTGLVAGGIVTIDAAANIVGVGSGSILVTAQSGTATPCGVDQEPSEEYGLFVLDDGVNVLTGGGSELELSFQRVQNLLDAGELSEEQAQQEADSLRSAQGAPSDDTDASKPAFVRGGGVSISGTGRWTDASGGLHPTRNVEVRAFTSGLFGLSEVGATTTDASGTFTLSLNPDDLGDSPRNITVRVFARNFAADLRTPPSWIIFGADTYFRERVFADVTDGQVLSGQNFTVNNTGTADRAFSIADAMIVGSDYMQLVQGSRLDQIDVNYPRAGTGTASFYDGSDITMHRSKPYAWDVILHEYGHYIEDEFNLTEPAGGPHACAENLIISRGKRDGARLSWSEGLATYIAIAAQQVTNTSALGVPNAGDTRYDSINATSGAAWSYDNEARDSCNGVSEGSETNVSRALWDIADGTVDGDDQVALGHGDMWRIIRDAGSHENLSDIWNEMIGGRAPAEIALMGAAFAQNVVSAELTAPVDGDVLGMTPPTFEWRKNGLNAFQVRFYDEVFTEVGVSPELGDVATWTPTQSEWDAISMTVDTLLWVVEGRNDDSPATGTYWSGARKLGGVDFAFVIDDTGSMSEEIGGVRSALLNFLSTFDPASTDISFQLTTFKDNVTVREPTRDLAQIQAQVSALSAGGGSDCPEESVGGLAQGTLAMRRAGTVLFATDADPRPGSDLTGLLTQIRSTGARVNVLLSGTCSSLRAAGQNAGVSSMEDLQLTDNSFAADGGFENAIDAFSQIATATGGSFAFVPEVNFSASGSVRYANTAENILSAATGPRTVLLTPPVLHQGSSGTVTVFGQNTSFTSDTTAAFSGGGVSVLDIEVVDPVTVRMQVRVDEGVETGFQDLTVQTQFGSDTETALGLGVLEIIGGTSTPILVTASPATATLGATTTVELSGLNTNFSDALSTVSFGPGITVDAVRVGSPTSLQADITVQEDALIGFSTVKVDSGAESAFNSVTDFFRIESRPVSIGAVANIDLDGAEQGTTVELQITVEGIMLDRDATRVEFSDIGVDALDVQACENQVLATVSVARDAPPGARDIIVRSGGEEAVAINGFTVFFNANSPPTASFAEDLRVDELTAVTVSVDATDEDGDTLSYSWSQTAGVDLGLVFGNDASFTFDAPDVEADTDVQFSVEVSDGVDQAQASINVTIVRVNNAPTLSLVDSLTVTEGETVNLIATGDDADGDALSFTWEQTDGPPLGLSFDDAASQSFTAPDVSADTEYGFTVTVSDGEAQVTASITLTVSALVTATQSSGGGGCSYSANGKFDPMLLLLLAVAFVGAARRGRRGEPVGHGNLH